MPLELSVTRVGPESEAILRNLCQHYVHDMSEWFGNDTLPDGSFAYDITRWWDPQRDVYLARLGSVLAGFAVVGSAQQWTQDAATRDVSEFFVLRKHRRSGTGAALAAFLWNQHPGDWLVRVLEANRPAVPFWRKAVQQRAGEHYEEQELLLGERAWRFFRFSTR